VIVVTRVQWGRRSHGRKLIWVEEFADDGRTLSRALVDEDTGVVVDHVWLETRNGSVRSAGEAAVTPMTSTHQQSKRSRVASTF